MTFMLYQQSRTITAPRSRYKRYGVTPTWAKTDYVYLTTLTSKCDIDFVYALMVKLEIAYDFSAIAVSYVADFQSDCYTIKFTVGGTRLNLPLDIKLEVEEVEQTELTELGADYTTEYNETT